MQVCHLKRQKLSNDKLLVKKLHEVPGIKANLIFRYKINLDQPNDMPA